MFNTGTPLGTAAYVARVTLPEPLIAGRLMAPVKPPVDVNGTLVAVDEGVNVVENDGPLGGIGVSVGSGVILVPPPPPPPPHAANAAQASAIAAQDHRCMTDRPHTPGNRLLNEGGTSTVRRRFAVSASRPHRTVGFLPMCALRNGPYSEYMTTHRRFFAVLAAPLAAALALASCAGGAGTHSTPAGAPLPFVSPTPEAQLGDARHVCPPPAPGTRTCLALVRTDIGAVSLSGVHTMTLGYIGYGPLQLQSAYKTDPTKGVGQTVAIVDAFDDPNAESDLATYRSTFGLPACTTANGCFRKVDQYGNSQTYPYPDADWAGEISLDLDAVSAMCPNCHILLVEAASNGNRDLATSVATAASKGAQVISNSYGGNDGDTLDDAYYDQPGHVIVASSGDEGYGTSQPAEYPGVVAVGGTRLVPAANARGWSEKAWTCRSAAACSPSGTGGSGSACSPFVAKPAWQTDTGCTMRSLADISAVADPDTGIWVYDSYGTTAGFYVYGGTSVAAPVVASMYALAGNAATLAATTSSAAAQRIWKMHWGHVFDVTQGTNQPSSAGSCSPSWNYICNARPGYDGITGWGTPNGVGAL